MRVAALGRTHWLYDATRAAAAAGHTIVLVGTAPASPEYRVDEGDFARLATELGARFFCDAAINRPRYAELVEQSGAEVAISVNWPTLIGQELLDAFPHGVINAHAGDLPRYRGNASPNWAILAGEDKVVLTLHRMTVDLDAGPIVLQRELPLTGATYIGDVYASLDRDIPSMFVEVLEQLAHGPAQPREQPTDPSLALRCFPRLPRDGEIDWSRSAEELARLVRASSRPFAGAYSFVGTTRLIVWRARPERLPFPWLGVPGQVAERRLQRGEVAVLTGDGVLVLQEVEAVPGPPRPATEVLTSMRMRLGVDLASEVERLSRQVADLEGRVGGVDPPDAPA